MVPDAPLSPIGPYFRLLFTVDRYEELACRCVGRLVIDGRVGTRVDDIGISRHMLVGTVRIF